MNQAQNIPAVRRAPEAASLPDGTPHADPWLASRGWQAERGVYIRHQTQAEADHDYDWDIEAAS